jgi:hypothetical protein
MCAGGAYHNVKIDGLSDSHTVGTVPKTHRLHGTVLRSPPALGLDMHASFGTVSGILPVQVDFSGQGIVQPAECLGDAVYPCYACKTSAAPAGRLCSVGPHGVRWCRLPRNPILSACPIQSHVTPSDRHTGSLYCCNCQAAIYLPTRRVGSRYRHATLGTRSRPSALTLCAAGCRDLTVVRTVYAREDDRCQRLCGDWISIRLWQDLPLKCCRLAVCSRRLTSHFLPDSTCVTRHRRESSRSSHRSCICTLKAEVFHQTRS